MNANLVVLGLVFPLGAVSLILLCLLGFRIMQHRERMAMIAQGMEPPIPVRPVAADLRAGLITAGVGAGLTLGELPLGLGPWLMSGLIPLCVGIGLVIYARMAPRSL